MSRRRTPRDLDHVISTGDYVPGHVPVARRDDDASELPRCRGCKAAGLDVPGPKLLLGSPACAEHAERWAFLPLFDVPRTVRSCSRCFEPITVDRDRMEREIALYGQLTGVCSRCFDTRAADWYMPITYR